MGMSNAEKQHRYRERALRDPDGLLLTRLQVMLSPSADSTLRRICARTGKTKRESRWRPLSCTSMVTL
jgi:hypothetical protein